MQNLVMWRLIELTAIALFIYLWQTLHADKMLFISKTWFYFFFPRQWICLCAAWRWSAFQSQSAQRMKGHNAWKSPWMDSWLLFLAVLDNQGGENRLDVFAETFSKVADGLWNVRFNRNTVPWNSFWVSARVFSGWHGRYLVFLDPHLATVKGGMNHTGNLYHNVMRNNRPIFRTESRSEMPSALGRAML